MATSTIKELVGRLNAIHNNASGDVTKDKSTYYQLLLASRELNAALEPPSQTAVFAAFSGLHLTCIRLAIELRLFEQLSSSENPLTLHALVAESGADEAFVLSIARVLVAKVFMAEARTGEGEKAFTATDMTRHMTQPSVRAGLIFHYDSGLPLLGKALPYFRSTNFHLPEGRSPGLFQYAFETADEDYIYWSKQPGVMENFNTFMQGYFGGDAQPTPIEWFPFDQVCLDGFDATKGEYAYVDVGGGKGQNLQAILEKYGDPVKGGKFMVQDLPRVIEDIDKSGMALDARIEKLGYDYFTAQPIRGARTYSFENVFHDYNDTLSSEILGVIKEAMVPGYSKLLIPSLVLPDEGVPFIMCALDVMLNCTNSGKERSAAQWSELLESSGFKIVKIWTPPGPGNAVIEAELI